MILRLYSNHIRSSRSKTIYNSYSSTFLCTGKYDMRQSPVICNWRTVFKHRLGHSITHSMNMASRYMTSGPLYRLTIQ